MGIEDRDWYQERYKQPTKNSQKKTEQKYDFLNPKLNEKKKKTGIWTVLISAILFLAAMAAIMQALLEIKKCQKVPKMVQKDSTTCSVLNDVLMD